MHAEQIEYRYVMIRELRRHGAKHRTGSTGCIEQERVYARSREAAASQERDRGVVAKARPQGTTSSPRSPVARRQ